MCSTFLLSYPICYKHNQCRILLLANIFIFLVGYIYNQSSPHYLHHHDPYENGDPLHRYHHDTHDHPYFPPTLPPSYEPPPPTTSSSSPPHEEIRETVSAQANDEKLDLIVDAKSNEDKSEPIIEKNNQSDDEKNVKSKKNEEDEALKVKERVERIESKIQPKVEVKFVEIEKPESSGSEGGTPIKLKLTKLEMEYKIKEKQQLLEIDLLRKKLEETERAMSNIIARMDSIPSQSKPNKKVRLSILYVYFLYFFFLVL